MLQPCFDVWRGVPAALDILLLAASMNSMVRHDDVGTSLKSTVTEFAHPALLSLVALPPFVITSSTFFTRSQISSFFLPPADCAALREPAGITRELRIKKSVWDEYSGGCIESPDNEYSGTPVAARGWPLATP